MVTVFMSAKLIHTALIITSVQTIDAIPFARSVIEQALTVSDTMGFITPNVNVRK